MKKVLFALCLILPMLFSCSDDEQYVSFEQSELEVDFKGGSFIINVSANCNWDLGPMANLSWVNERKINQSQIALYIQENETYEDRSYSVNIISENGKHRDELNIIQKEGEGILCEEIIGGDESGEFNEEEHNIAIKLKTNIETPSIYTPKWITIKSNGRAFSDKTYNFYISKNDTGEERIGVIVFVGEKKSWSYSVKQKSTQTIPPEVLPSKITFKEGENVLLDNNSDFTLTPVFTPVECTEKDLEWISSNKNVVTVSDGVLKAVGNGEAKVTAKSKLADVSASINVTVKIEAQQIMLMDGTAQMSTETNWTFGYKTKIRFGSIPENAYLGDVFITSSNESVVSIVDGYLVANSNEGTSQIDIYDRYSLLHTIVNITVKRCITQGGFKLINQNSDALMMSFAGTVQNSKGVEVLGASLVDSSNRVLALADNISVPSDIVQFSTEIINMTSLFGIYIIHEYDFPKLRFLVSYRCGTDSKIYQEYIDIDPFKQIGW